MNQPAIVVLDKCAVEDLLLATGQAERLEPAANPAAAGWTTSSVITA